MKSLYRKCVMAVLKPSKSQVTKKKINKNRKNPEKIGDNGRKKNALSQPVHNYSGICKRRKRKRQVDFEICNNSHVYKQAKELQSSLPLDFPSEIRIMLPSHVSGGFWLVYIVRSNGSEGLHGVANSDKRTLGKETTASEVAKDVHHKCAVGNNHATPKLESTSDDVVAEIFGRTTVPESVIAFKEVGSIGNFEIFVNGLVGGSELSKLVRAKYYELCCSQRSFLHECLLQRLNHKLVSGIICEVVILADAIKACEITTSIGMFFVWGQTLKAFEDLGMKVDFLCARLDQLVYLAMKLKMCRESRSIAALGVKPLEAQEADSKLESAFEEVKNAPW